MLALTEKATTSNNERTLGFYTADIIYLTEHKSMMLCMHL